jgi:hypothetical protein
MDDDELAVSGCVHVKLDAVTTQFASGVEGRERVLREVV